jgi:paraquat-inducible protein A
LETVHETDKTTVGAAADGSGLIACHDCDLLHQARPLPAGAKALCSRCGTLLYQQIPNGRERALALNLAALLLFFMANAFPFLSLNIGGRMEENLLFSASLAFFRAGMGELGILVFLTSILFPFVTIAGMLYVLLAQNSGYLLPGAAAVYRLVRAVAPWSLIGVFMLGVLISIVKLLDLATVIPGISLYSFAALLVVTTAAKVSFDRQLLWSLGSGSTLHPPGATAAGRDLVGCHTCGLLVAQPDHHDRAYCPRCDSPLHVRRTNSVARTWALVCAAWLLLIPANVYPVMTVIRFGQGEPNTIISGIIHLIEAQMWPLALLVFFASFVVPLLKLLVLSFLLISVQKRSPWRPEDRTRLYRATEVIGTWSMVDVFLVAILTALVNQDALATVEPQIGVSFFAAVVVLTLFAAHSFDPRLIWDNCGETR